MNGDITYCQCSCININCRRHYKNIDWEIPKHKYFGASMSDFSDTCTNFKEEDEHGKNE